MQSSKQQGFTLIELLVVIGIIATLLGTALVALNPLDQLNRANDVVSSAVSKDFSTAVNDYFANNKTFPWKKDLACQVELAKGPTLKDIPSCVQDITESQQLQKNVTAQSQSKDIYISECNNAVALCYHPKSQLFGKSPDAKYTKNGALDPNCPNNGKPGECYTCTFSTNDARECFDALNPNGTLARSETPDPNKAVPIPSRHSKNVCNNPASGQVGCMADIVTNSSGDPLSTINLPAGIGPLQLHTAYNLPCTPGGSVSANCATPATFGPQTIAVIDAYDAPNIENDLAAYDSSYGLPPCTKANGCLTVVNQNGASSPLPSVDVSWAVETTLDVQMAHATCQTCKILVVEANSAYLSDIGVAVNRAAAMGATAISNSYGAGEWSGETAYNSYYNHPGTFITVASGDGGHQAEYPAASSNVIAVGGTTLSLFADNTYASESGWINSGLGCATYETANSFQTNLSNWFYTACDKQRGIVDVSAVADPDTGVAVYMSPLSAGGWSVRGGWYIVGGTSVSSPVVAAALTMAGTPPATGPAAAFLYSNQNKFRDIVSAMGVDCGTSICIAGPGYDGPTGLGSPDFAQTIGPSSSPTPTPILSEYPAPWKEAVNFEGKTPATSPDSTWHTQFMEVPYNAKMDYPNTFTIEAWIKPDAPSYNFTSSTNYNYTIVNNTANLTMYIKPNGTNIAYEYAFNVDANNSTQCIPTGIFSSYDNPWYDVTYWKTVSPSEFTTWKHVAGVYKNGTFSIYENGVKLNAGYQGATICNDKSNTLIGANDGHTALKLGITSTPSIGDYFNGDIEDVRISNVARYTTNTFIPPTLPFTPDANTMMLYHFDNNTQDASGNGLDGMLFGDVKYVQSIPPSGISTPTPTPTQSASSCSSLPVVTLTPTSTQTAIVGTTTQLPYTLTVTSTDPGECSSTYTTNIGLHSGWGVVWDENGTLVSSPPPTITLAGGETKSIALTVYVPPYASTGVGDYMFQIWVLKQGQTFTNPVNGYIQVVPASSTPVPTPTLTPTPTPTPKPTNTPTPTPGPTSSGGQYPIGPYKLDDTKFLKTYAVLTFPTQSFPPNWSIDVSFRPDFGGVVTKASIGYSVNGVPATADSDTILSVAYAGDGNFGTSTSTSYAAQTKLTSKHVAFISMPYEWKQYANGCGQTIYWRVVGWPGDSSGLIGPTYTGTLDCTTKVGIIDSSLWWTYPTSDFNKDGIVDWTDYVIGSLWTKFRAGGWQPPE